MPPVLGVMAAMPEELEALMPRLEGRRTVRDGGREFHHGRLAGAEVVLVLARIGKVAAATTAALLATRQGAAALVFTGVAGGLHDDTAIGDVVLGQSLMQHDLDVSPLFPPHEVPYTGLARFPGDPGLLAGLEAAARRVLAREAGQAPAPGLRAPRLHRGLVISGDRFIASAEAGRQLRERHPEALAVEMEGAAVAQVCHDLGLPQAVLRSLSDRADDAAHGDFLRFVGEVAAPRAAAVLVDWLEHGGWSGAGPA